MSLAYLWQLLTRTLFGTAVGCLLAVFALSPVWLVVMMLVMALEQVLLERMGNYDGRP